MHRVHIPDLPWEEVSSPTKKFHSYFRNISLALGGMLGATAVAVKHEIVLAVIGGLFVMGLGIRAMLVGRA